MEQEEKVRFLRLGLLDSSAILKPASPLALGVLVLFGRLGKSLPILVTRLFLSENKMAVGLQSREQFQSNVICYEPLTVFGGEDANHIKEYFF